MQSHTGTVDGALLPSAANTLNGQARRTAKKAPSTVTNFFKTATSIFYFSLNADIAVRKMVRLETGVSSYYKCIRFFTDAIISYSMQKSIVGILNIYTLFPVFLCIFNILYDKFRLFFNKIICFSAIFHSVLYIF